MVQPGAWRRGASPFPPSNLGLGSRTPFAGRTLPACGGLHVWELGRRLEEAKGGPRGTQRGSGCSGTSHFLQLHRP